MGTVSASSPRTAVYTPKRVFPHAALLRQACAHCGKFLAAASRRSRGRVSVPVWLIVLSDQLPIIATVGRDPTVQLIGRRLLPRRVAPFLTLPTRSLSPYGITLRFRRLAPASGQIAHVFLTRPPRDRPEGRPVRLACIRHAASVDPEPGSNSPPKSGASGFPIRAAVFCVGRGRDHPRSCDDPDASAPGRSCFVFRTRARPHSAQPCPALPCPAPRVHAVAPLVPRTRKPRIHARTQAVPSHCAHLLKVLVAPRQRRRCGLTRVPSFPRALQSYCLTAGVSRS